MILALLLAAQALPGVPCLTCATATAPAATPIRHRSRFRLDPATSDALTAKDRAIREDGSRCGTIGARQCTRKPRTIFRTDFTD